MAVIDYLQDFIRTISAAGCKTIIIHARKAWLKGLSPSQNRELPPLRYEVVHQIKQDFQELEIIINGGFSAVAQIQEQYHHVDGVMVGRAVCNNPYILAEIELQIFANTIILSRHEVIQYFMGYVEKELKRGICLRQMTRHLLGLFHGQAGARAYRRYLSDNTYRPNSGIEVVKEAMSLVRAA